LAITGLLEVGIALLSHSVGLLGDALHSLADVSTSLVVFVGFRLSKRPASPANPFETAVVGPEPWLPRWR
jgi:divalent metal cation (Fe/Co/Zn/Cd) transporter